MGELDLLPSEFWQLTLSEFTRKARGYRRRQDEQWRHTRKLVATLWNINGGDPTRQGRAMLEADIYRLPTDPLPAPGMSPEETDALWEELDKLDADLLTK